MCEMWEARLAENPKRQSRQKLGHELKMKKTNEEEKEKEWENKRRGKVDSSSLILTFI